MADKKISALTGATTPLAGTEVLPIVQSGATVKVAVSDLTAGRSVSATNFIPSGSSVPTNGVYLPAANSVGIATNGANALTVDASKNLSVNGQVTANYDGTSQAFYANQNNSGGDGMNCVVPSDSTSRYYHRGYSSSAYADRFYIYSNGNMVNANNSYGSISDIKLKENVVDATSKLDDVMKLKVRNFNFKDTPDLKQIGFIAQELQDIFPKMIDDQVDRNQEGEDLGTITKTIKTSVLIPILVKALQELKTEFDQYKLSHP